MRSYGALFTSIPQVPDTVQTMLMTGGSSAQAADWPSSAAQFGANGSSIGAHVVCFTGMTTAGAAFSFMVNLVSTHANVPTSGSSVTTGTTAGSTGNSIPVIGEAFFQIPSWSTGYSVAAYTSGVVMAQVWRK